MARHPAFDKAWEVIDGWIHITPRVQHKEDYFNYKCFHSIQMQVVCDATGRFLNIFVDYPGTVHDRGFQEQSTVPKCLYTPQGYFLLGDGGYRCLETSITVITPYRTPQERVQACFNNCHARARSVLERAFGVMEARWRSTLSKAMEVQLSFCTDVVMACGCAFLHNICIR